MQRAPSGLFLLRVYRRGELIEVFEEKNLIVVGSQQTHAKLLGGDVASQSVTRIGFGTNGTAPAFSNSSLTGAYTKAVDAVSYPAANQAQFALSLGTGEANGMAISEFGLITAGGTLYARKTRSTPLNKGDDITLAGTWTVSF
ncbi:hypothetical protein ACPPTR_10490 [Ralstonia pseudosolanacearum]|uniref:hypothetical protein n=1 Tax=Ralstonia pseudosolanacearum TaxID=1310165 RepID=UPI000B92E69C|nr:hypothetical protein [Ralstonia pseudosolanacearum]MCD9228932.1 hypothetical protein [Ralstonia pseudosolanacearum]